MNTTMSRSQGHDLLFAGGSSLNGAWHLSGKGISQNPSPTPHSAIPSALLHEPIPWKVGGFGNCNRSIESFVSPGRDQSHIQAAGADLPQRRCFCPCGDGISLQLPARIEARPFTPGCAAARRFAGKPKMDARLKKTDSYGMSRLADSKDVSGREERSLCVFYFGEVG